MPGGARLQDKAGTEGVDEEEEEDDEGGWRQVAVPSCRYCEPPKSVPGLCDSMRDHQEELVSELFFIGVSLIVTM